MRKLKRTFKQNRIFTQNNPLSPRICPELAKEIGLSESILLLQYEFWIATEGEEKGGYIWVRKTIREIKQIFSFWGTSTINRLINNLVLKGYLIADALDEEDRKTGRWVRFGFDELAKLSSIKIICAETGQTICADLGGICAETGQEATQNGTNNTPSPYIGSKSTKREELSPHARLMDFLQTKTGPIANGAREGKAVRWLLDHGYDPQQCEDCFDYLAAQTWRTVAVSWVTVESQIGAWVARNGNGAPPKKSQAELAASMGCSLEKTASDYITGFSKALTLSSTYNIQPEIDAIPDAAIRAQVSDWYQHRGARTA